MKRLLMSIFACLIVLLSLVVTGTAQAQSLVAAASPSSATVEQTKPKEDMIEKVKTEFLPQIESILTPEQTEQLESAVVEEKTSLRKAFKSIMLTPDQKSKLATVFKSLPKKDFFASLTPEEKKQFFMKKKEMFMPTTDEIADFKAAKEK